jgi:DNA-binding CsgD family transcriptional regulator
VASQLGTHGPALSSSLVGREGELEQLDALLAAGRSSSQALLVVGEAGIGKSALLEAASSRASAAGGRVLAAWGVEAEAELAFAGLHQLLRPVLDRADRLPPRQAAALRCAFGMGEESTPERFLIGLATLTLLADVAERQPFLVVVDDAAWLDRGSLEALAFAARRFQAEPIVVLVASRTAEAVEPFGAGFKRMLLGRLDESAANRLLDARRGSMPSERRARVLAGAAGNPLALLELAAAHLPPGPSGPAGPVGPAEAAAASLAPSPATRLEGVFADRLSELPEPTRRILTVAASADGNDLRPVLRVAAAMDLAPDALLPAERAGLVTVGADELRFRHPLVRSVIYHAAPFGERRAAHLGLAAALTGDPDRHAWHLAAATLGPDAAIASALEATADRSRMRAGYAASARALERAAELSTEPSEQARRLALAAEMAFAAGRPGWVEELARRVNALTHDPELRARATLSLAYVQALGGGRRADDVLSIPAIEAVVAEAPAVGLGILAVAAGLGFTTGDDGLRATAQRLVRSVPGPADEPWRLYVLAASDPARNAPQISPQLLRFAATPPDDPSLLRVVAQIPFYIDQPVAASELLTRAVNDMRARGDLGGLVSFLVTLGLTDVWRGRWLDARALADEAASLANETGQPLMAALAQALGSLVAALQGRAEAAREQAVAAVAISDAGLVAAIATWALGLEALAGGRHDEASAHLQRMFTPRLPCAHFAACGWAVADLVEAATHQAANDGVADRLGPVVADAQRQAEAGTSVRAKLVARRAKALLASGEDADALFRAALATEGADDWPFELARARLDYGEWLRRRRRIIDARQPLRAAQEAFIRLGAKPWAERARAELRASGVPVGAPPVDAVEQLTPQQRQIAQLAAAGLTNREIGAKLFLSPRTVGFHLRNVFPKLHVTSRSQLVHALGEPVAGESAPG